MHNWDDIFIFDTSSRTGLRWKVDRLGYQGRKAAKAGTEAGTLLRDGYGQVMLDGKGYLTHRIIWEMHNGEVSADKEVDHEDGNRSNNVLSNLRVVPQTINAKNKGRYSNNTSGYTGVYWSCLRNSAVARWNDLNGTQRSKTFSAGVIGRDVAISDAKAYRDAQIRLLNLQGAGYTERHINGNT